MEPSRNAIYRGSMWWGILHVSTSSLSLEHAQIWNRGSIELSLGYRDRHTKYSESGLLNYLEFDERVGVKSYDRSRTAGGAWRMNHGVIKQLTSIASGWQTGSQDADDAFVRFSNEGGPSKLGHYTYSHPTTGQYSLESLKISGSGSQYRIEPTKAGHDFSPTQSYISISDNDRDKENVDFFDQSSFTQEIEVYYAPRAEDIELDPNSFGPDLVDLGSLT